MIRLYGCINLNSDNITLQSSSAKDHADERIWLRTGEFHEVYIDNSCRRALSVAHERRAGRDREDERPDGHARTCIVHIT